MLALFRSLIGSVTTLERRVVLATALAIIVITAVPPVYGWAMAERGGKAWTGRQFLSPADATVYLSYIDQAKSGAVLFEDLYTTEPVPMPFNPLWYGIGRFAAIFGLSPIAAFHAARLLLIFPLAAIAYLFVAYFLRERRHRLAAFLLLMFGSGLGSFAAPFLPEIPPGLGTYRWPIDFWVGEANLFMTMTYSPHFVASWALWLVSALVLAASFERRSALGAAAAGVLAFALFSFHPYHAPVLYALGAAWCAAAAVRQGFRAAPWAQLAIFGAVSAPPLAYHYALANLDAHAVAHALTNHTLTPPVFFVIVGLGAISLLWIPGIRAASRSGAIAPKKIVMLAAWIVVQAALLYAPVRFQRRFLQGLQFPMAVLAVPFLFAAYARLTSSGRLAKRYVQVGAVYALAAVFLISTGLAATRNAALYADTSDRVPYVEASEARAARWLRETAPTDAVILSTPGAGNLLVPWSGRRVYAGHWSETIDIERKTLEIIRFYAKADDAERAAFAASRGITHVYVGPTERAILGAPLGGLFERVFADGVAEIYVLKRPAA